MSFWDFYHWRDDLWTGATAGAGLGTKYLLAQMPAAPPVEKFGVLVTVLGFGAVVIRCATLAFLAWMAYRTKQLERCCKDED